MTDTRSCSVAVCDRGPYALGLCKRHYERQRRHGSPEIALRRGRKPRRCSLIGCERRHFGHGLCSVHYQRRRRHGSPEVVGSDGRKRDERGRFSA